MISGIAQKRSLPLSLRIAVLFGGIPQRIGWIFLSFGMIFVWIFGVNSDFWSRFTFRGQREKSSAIVTSVGATGFKEGGSGRRHSSDDDGTPVIAHHYNFEHHNRTYTGVSYARGNGAFTVGEKVNVEFPIGRPETSRIIGLRHRPLGSGAVFIFIFPIIGFGMVAYGLRRGWNSCRLLSHGELTAAKLVEKRDTNAKVDNRNVFAMTFQFVTADGQTHQVMARTHLPHRLEDDAEEALLYHEHRPSDARLLDDIAGEPQFDTDGRLKAARMKQLLISTVPPLAALIVNGLFILL